MFLFQAIQFRKMCFTIFQKEKTPFQAIKTRSLKSCKIDIFPKGNGFGPWFWSKIGHFCMFLFQAKQARKMCFTIFQKEKTPFQAIKTRSSKSRKIEIFPQGLVHGLVQNRPFLHVFILGKIGQENVFYDILEGKNASLGYKNKKLKQSKN